MLVTNSPTSLILRLKAAVEIFIAIAVIAFGLLLAYAIHVEWQ
jgi:hydrogenase/urease accessory protein HupE